MTPDVIRRLTARGAFIAALALVLGLSVQLRLLRAAYADLEKRLREPHAGMYVPTVKAGGLPSDSVVLADTVPGRRQLLFIFTTECPYCRASIPAWIRLAAAAESLTSPRVTVVGITLSALDSTRVFAAQHQLTFQVVRFPERKLVYIYKAQTVPVTMVLDTPGRVLYAHTGQVINAAVEDSVLAALRFEPAPSVQRTASPGRRP